MRRIKILALPVLTVLLLTDFGCSKKTFNTDSTYYEEMQSFITEDRDGKDLFSPDVFSQDTFIFNNDSLHHYFYKFDSTSRVISILISDKPHIVISYNPNYPVYDALLEVKDAMVGHMFRINGFDTVSAYNVADTVTRYAYFLKLYGDAYQYRGWRFWGFVGGEYKSLYPAGRKITSSTGVEMSARPPNELPPDPLDPSLVHNGYYIRKDSILKFPLGDSLTLFSYVPDRIFTEIGDNVIKAFDSKAVGKEYNIGWRIPSTKGKFYHLVLFDMPGRFTVDTVNQVIESTLVKDKDFIIPYALDF